MDKNNLYVFKSILKDSKISCAYILLKAISFKLIRSESGYVQWVLKLYPRIKTPAYQKIITKFLLSTKNKSILDIEDQRFSHVTLKFCKVIKPFVSEKEKGLIIISFEKELGKIVFSEHFEEIQKYYRIVFIPSWTGAISLPLMALAEKADDTFFVLPVHWHERHSCNELSPHCKTLDFNAASWVNSDFYELGRKKGISIV